VSAEMTDVPLAGGVLRTEASQSPVDESEDRPKALLFLALLYLVFDYGRPQDLVPAIGIIRPAAVSTVLLAVAYLASARRWVGGHGQFLAVWAFVALLFAWVPFATNNFFAYWTAYSMLLLLPFVLSLPVCLNSLPAVRGMLAFCVLLMGWQAVWAIIHGGRGTGASLYDENDIALYINTFLPFAYFLLRAERRGRWKLFYLAAMLIGIAGVVSTRSRGGFIGLLAMGAVVWLLSQRKIRALALIGVLACGVALFAGDKYWERMSTATDAKEGTGKARIEMWKSAWAMFLDNPIGVGGGNFPVRFPQYQTAWFWHGEWGRPAHSVWFTLLAELGVPGAIIYGMLLFFNLRDSVRLRKIGRSVGGDDGALLVALGSAFLASFAGFFSSGTFLSVLYYPHYWYLTGFLVAASAVAGAARHNNPIRAAA
jgi:O-antigen ligase